VDKIFIRRLIDMDFRPSGVCSQLIRVDVDGDIIKNVEFVGGCNGNTQGIASLVVDMNVHDAISRMEGITCGNKPTSCPDQLAKALRQAIGE
jgi:uncharacterized protein (TIGR03905 family)